MVEIESIVSDLASFLWGIPLLFILIGGGLFLLIYSRLIQFKYFNNHIKKEYWKSIKWHGALHMFGNLSSVILYSGYIPPVCLLCFYRNNIKKLLDSK